MIAVNFGRWKEFEAKPALKNVLVAALNKTASGARTDAAELITRRYGVQKKHLAVSTWRVIRAKTADLQASLVVHGAKLSLTKFKGLRGNRRDPRGARVEIKLGSPTWFRRGFTGAVGRRWTGGSAGKGELTTDGASGHVGMWERAGSEAYPIKEIKGPSAPNMVGYVKERLDRMLVERFKKAFEQEFNFRVRSRGGRT